MSQADAAVKAKLSTGTVSKYFRIMRDLYGEEGYPKHTAGENLKTDRDRGQMQRRAASMAKWSDARDLLTEGYSTTAWMSRELAQIVLEAKLKNPEKAAEELTLADAVLLMSISEKAAKAAELLQRRSGNDDGPDTPAVPPGTLEGFTTSPDEHRDVFTLLEDAFGDYKRKREAIEVGVTGANS